MLGRLGMSVEKAVTCYGTLSPSVFSNVKQTGGDGRFKASKLEKLVMDIVREQTGKEHERMIGTPPCGKGCKTYAIYPTCVVKLTGLSFVPAMSALNMNARIPRLFRTYQAPKHQAANCAIWEAVRATSAAPTFFKRIVIDGEPYVDGGMGCNNPVQQVLQEAELLFPDRHVACIVSIGAGQAQTIGIPKPGWFQPVLPFQVVDAIRQIATDCEASAQVAAQRFERTPGVYFRFNVEQGLQEVRLEQWERLDAVRAHTGQYIRMADVDRKLDTAVASICGRQRVVPTVHTSMAAPDLCRSCLF